MAKPLKRGKKKKGPKAPGNQGPATTTSPDAPPTVVTKQDGDNTVSTFTAVVRRPERDADDDTDSSHDHDVRSAAGGGGAAGGGNEAEGNEQEGEQEQPIHLAELPGGVQQEEHACDDDTVASTITYAGNITHGGVTLSGSLFGVTSSSLSRFTAVTITPGTGVFTVTATLTYTIKWDTCHGAGPGGQVNIPNENAPVITAANYTQVADDLTPNMGDLSGRPPRTHFWAQDLTETHEQFHAAERRRFGGEGATRAQTWLNTQTAGSAADVTDLMNTAWQDQVKDHIDTQMTNPGKEMRAYADGAGSYRSRANAVRAKGAAGNYPAGAPAAGGGGGSWI